MNFYNDNDPYVCEWTENLIKAELIPPGDVVCKPIEEIQPDELERYTQCHFFNGIAGWSYALELAGWPRDVPVWTGSCPCQDFSNAGRKAGFAGERDLWPAWFRLIRECRPDTVFGEQVDDSLEWYDRTADEMEDVGYTVGACVIPACAVGARHERSRLWFVAYAKGGWRGNGIQAKRRLSIANSGVVRGEGNFWANQPEPLAVAYGVSNRVEQLHAYGNSIVPQVAAEFIRAYCEVSEDAK